MIFIIITNLNINFVTFIIKNIGFVTSTFRNKGCLFKN